MAASILACPVCGEREGLVEIERKSQYGIRRCPSCELQFSDPMAFSATLYDDAYGVGGGPVGRGGGGVDYKGWMAEVAGLTRHERALRFPFYRNLVLTSAQHVAFRWLRRTLPPGSRVLDLGCGPGTFMAAMRAVGFIPVGIDVARPACEHLRSRGFEVHVGTLADYPESAAPPNAVTFFEVLEHLDDPVGFLRQVEARFPGVPIAFTVPSPRRVSLLQAREEWDFPPHHLTRWSEKALKVALESANLSLASITFPAPGPLEFRGTGLGRWLMPAGWAAGSEVPDVPAAPGHAATHEAFNAAAPWRAATFWLGKAVIFSPLMLLRRLQGYSATGVCVTATSRRPVPRR